MRDYLTDEEVHIRDVPPKGRVAWWLGWSEGFPFIAGGVSFADPEARNAALETTLNLKLVLSPSAQVMPPHHTVLSPLLRLTPEGVAFPTPIEAGWFTQWVCLMSIGAQCWNPAHPLPVAWDMGAQVSFLHVVFSFVFISFTPACLRWNFFAPKRPKALTGGSAHM